MRTNISVHRRNGRTGAWLLAGVMASCGGIAACSDNGNGTTTSGNVIPPNPDAELDTQLTDIFTAQNVKPVERPAAQDPAKVELGRNLFFEKEISGRRNIACSTCHHPLLGSADGQSQSRGQGATGLGPQRVHGPKSLFLARNTLSLWNRGVTGWDTMFWDGRLGGNLKDGYTSPAGMPTPQEFSNSLAAFSIIPVTPDEEMRGFPGEMDVNGNPNEMADLTNDDFALIWPLVVKRAMAVPYYKQKLLEVFPGVTEDKVTIVHLGEAIGAFMTDAFTALDAPLDRYLAGDKTALSGAQKRGAVLFYGRAKCGSCHTGALQTDFGFHNVAAPQVGTGKGDEAPLDYGRGRITLKTEDRFKFRTPSLRNTELEGPWMHNGAYANLEDTVRHHLDPAAALAAYDDSQVESELVGTYQSSAATKDMLLSTLDPALKIEGAKLTDAEVSDLMAFLNALTDPSSLNLLHLIPKKLPSGLPTDD